MIDVGKIVNQALFVKRCTRSNPDRVYDVPSSWRYFCTHSDGRIWGAYCTYYRWEWDNTNRFINIDCAILVSGSPTKGYRYVPSYVPNQIDRYKNRKIRDGYYLVVKEYDKRANYPEVCETLDQILMWMELRQ